jgi:hypothetical protein
MIGGEIVLADFTQYECVWNCGMQEQEVMLIETVIIGRLYLPGKKWKGMGGIFVVHIAKVF